MNFSSPFQRSPSHPCPCTHSWSTKKKVESLEESISQSHIFSEKRSTSIFFESSTSSAAGPSHVDELPPTFDNYCHSSESEEEVNKFGRNNNYTIDSQKKNLDSHQAENSIFNQPLSGDMESRELNLGNLTDDIRNKGYRHPPYALSSSEAENDTSAGFKQSSPSLVEDSASSGSYNREPKESDEVSRNSAREHQSLVLILVTMTLRRKDQNIFLVALATNTTECQALKKIEDQPQVSPCHVLVWEIVILMKIFLKQVQRLIQELVFLIRKMYLLRIHLEIPRKGTRITWKVFDIPSWHQKQLQSWFQRPKRFHLTKL
ncbi:uncharacterized protein LOC120156659 isoform X1 [Hibiscus syriacus]|uniref:uncharacterized protein LOC120156659 isoform X1 n=1 Tax=Hibiscus syriacus TaxID=106335 RepID=UPI001922670D|nr:uncharacterized protein LOC120156659 isoform X1 [Hibiscus syriacus]